MKRFIITEEEKNHIKGLYEQSNNCFKNMKYEKSYLYHPEYYVDEKTEGNYLYYKKNGSNDWNSGSGKFIPKNNQSHMEKTFVWTCNGNKINIKNMGEFHTQMPS